MDDVRYKQLWWGDSITGTKEQLQSLGIGQERTFPGEAGGQSRQLNVLDPRGFKTMVERYDSDDEDWFLARIYFPDREASSDEERSTPFRGVSLRQRMWFDEYTGNADALVAAGLCRAEHLPGSPGMRKMRVTIFPDGTVPTGPATAVHQQRKAPGAKQIEKRRGDTFRVCVYLSEEEADLRKSANRQRRLEWEQRMDALPRPAPLMKLPGRDLTVSAPSLCIPPARHLRLVWSAPHHVSS